MGAIVLAIGIVLVFRLWTLQVIQHEEFQDLADNNLRRVATTTAIRGRIFDREGRELVTNRPTTAVVAPALRIEGYHQFDRLSQEQQDWVHRLAEVLSRDLDDDETPLTAEDIVARLTTTREGPLELRVVAVDVSIETVSYIIERSEEFVGVEIEARAVREYPHGSTMAHVLGYTGNISDAELELEMFEDYVASDIVGKTGVERSFEHILQGVRGTRVLEVNAQGRIQHVVEETEPTAGQDIFLTLDLYVQKATEDSLETAISVAQRRGYSDAVAGSAVVMCVNTGEIRALASYPTFDPSDFIGGISVERWEELTDEESNHPLNNRAISGAFPPASTFKSFMTVAAIDRLGWNAATTHICTGTWTGFGEYWPWRCWNRTGHGPQNLNQANYYSCDVPFYQAGFLFHIRDAARVNNGEERLDEIQTVARSFGYGERTGIDLPGEARGRVPDEAWKFEFNRDFPEHRTWLGGDTVNLSIGQGDMLATPLQVAYSHVPFANGGTLWRPQILHSIRDTRGEVIREIEPEVSANQPDASEEALTMVNQALRLVVTRGTGRGALADFPVPVAGKTGTAETGRRDPITGERDQDSHGWFVGYAPYQDPQYIIAVVIEHGGGGGAIAAPVARQIFAEIFEQDPRWVDTIDVSR